MRAAITVYSQCEARQRSITLMLSVMTWDNQP